MPTAFTNEGDFQVRITAATFKENPKEGDEHAFQVSLKGETPDGLNEAWGYMFFSHTVISGGNNAGRTNFEVNSATLKAMGVKDGYLGNLQEAIDSGNLYAEFSLKWDDYKGKRSLKVKYINPCNVHVSVADVDWKKVLAEFNGEASLEAQAVQVEAQISDSSDKLNMPDGDDIPF